MYMEKVRPGTGRETGLGHVQVSREAGAGSDQARFQLPE